MIKKYFSIIIVILSMYNLVCAEIYWSGNFYEQAMVSLKSTDDNISTNYFGISLLDLKLDVRPTDIIRVKSELEYILPHTQNSVFLNINNVTAVRTNTINAAISIDDYKITIGRFLPKWGKSKIFRPLDIFIPQSYFMNMLSFPGVDGLSFKYYTSNLSSIEFIAAPSIDIRQIAPIQKDLTDSTFLNPIKNPVIAANFEIHAGSFDNNIIFMHDINDNNSLIGFACKGDITVGLWSELFYSFNLEQEKTLFKGSLGIDYSFAKYYFVTAEYFYDESGTSDYTEYLSLASRNNRMTLGKNYIMLDFNKVTYTDITYGLTYMMNVSDRSFVLFPYYSNPIFENCILGISLYYFNGKQGREFSPDILGDIILNSYFMVRF